MNVWRCYFTGLLMLTLSAAGLPAGASAASSPATQTVVDVSVPPIVRPDLAHKIAPGVTIIPDPHVIAVPNIGVIEGRDAVLVVDTGLGAENGRMVYEYARKIAGDRKLYLT